MARKVHSHVHKNRLWARFWASWIQSTPSHPLCHLRLGIASDFIPSCFPTKISYTFLICMTAQQNGMFRNTLKVSMLRISLRRIRIQLKDKQCNTVFLLLSPGSFMQVRPSQRTIFKVWKVPISSFSDRSMSNCGGLSEVLRHSCSSI
jgi:hypothetical protein